MPNEKATGRSTLVTLVCLGAAALSVVSALDSYSISKNYARQFPDAYGVNSAQSRFAAANGQVPPGARLAYFTDLDLASEAHATAFLAARYALAPREIVLPSQGAPADVAIGNFTKPLDYAGVGAAQGYEVSADLGGGVVLYRRRAR